MSPSDVAGPLAGAAALALVVAALAAGAGVAVGDVRATQATACTGTVTDAADGGTIVSVQGARGGEKTPASLVAFDEEGRVDWVHRYGQGTVWGYDVDPLPNGNVFVTTTVREMGDGDTVVFEFDPQTGERVWQERFDALDTHDADLLAGGEEILVANMRRNVDGESRDRVFVYNRTTDAVTWEWSFREHGFDPEDGGEFGDDWTHVNDVDAVGEDHVLLSPRNLDQVLLVNRTSKEIELRLGSDGDHDVLHAQHNPDYLETDGGDPVFLVADSENDRVVEYARRDGGWERTWTLSGGLDWPRDADRLPNGNTLVTDSWNHRVVEVTPDGEVVWEGYAPWLVYDSERLRTGDGSGGPAMADVDAPREATLTNGSGVHDSEAALEGCADRLAELAGTTATPYPDDGGPPTATGTGWDYEAPPDGPLGLGGVGPLGVGAAVAVLAALALAVGVYRR